MIPYNTDAPLYHMPIATVGLIVLNTILFIAVPRSMVDFEYSGADVMLQVLSDPDLQADSEDENQQIDRAALLAQLEDAADHRSVMLSLEYGQGLKPWQWLTSIFMHANIMHLVFNMIALWAFGLVVEGKVGLARFLGLYLGIGVAQSAIEQLVMCLNGIGGSLGASAAIFGILGIAMVWAPKNEFEVFYQFGFRMGTAEIPIMVYGFLQLAIEVFNVTMGQFGISSGLLHLMGFAIGMSLGFVWLVRGWVDCEGWDLLTVLKGHEGRDFEAERLEKEAADLVNSSQRARSETAVRVKQTRPQVQVAKHSPKASTPTGTQPDSVAATIPVLPRSMFAPPPPSADDFADLFAPQASMQSESPEDRLNGLIEAGNHQAAVRALIELRKCDKYELQQAPLAKLIRDLVAGQDLNNAVPLMAEHIRRFTDNRIPLQINLAKIMLQKQRPQKALQALNSVDRLSADVQALESVTALIAHAENMMRSEAREPSN